jgi:PHS family inorganic phosphate transporter-like MFS transporter
VLLFPRPGSNSPAGPNATTYIITGELFPTRYRASCHGISAATGKLGSILAQIFSAYYKLDGSSPGEGRGKNYGTVLLVFSAAMILGAVVTHFWIPDVQYKDKKNKTLETLATGRQGRNSQSMARRLSFGTRSSR